MFSCKIDGRTELRLVERCHSAELFRLLEVNRAYLRAWHPWVDFLRTPADADKAVGTWLQQFANNRGFYAGIWHDGQLCGVVNHLTVDWPNRATALAYWLDAEHQGKGIMTACCRAMIAHAFDTWQLHRITIECATENARSRGVPERLGFKFEGTIRGIEWLHDHFADHAMYSLLKTDTVPWRVSVATKAEPVCAPMTTKQQVPVLAGNVA